MYRCDICDTSLLKRNKTEREQSKKHKSYYSNLILNRYVIKNLEVAKFEDVFDPYFTHQSRNFSFFTICIILRHHSDLFKFDDGDHPLDHKISIPNNITYRIESEYYSACTTESACDFLHKVKSIYSSSEIFRKIEIIFTSDPKDITRQHYLDQPKSMLCRKMVRRFHESTSQDFEYERLPDSFKDLWVCFTFKIKTHSIVNDF